jgi:hypothetical protein
MAALRRICVGLDGKIRDRFACIYVEIVQPGRIQSTSEYQFPLFRLPPRAQVIGSEPFLLSQAARCSCATSLVTSLTSSRNSQEFLYTAASVLQ